MLSDSNVQHSLACPKIKSTIFNGGAYKKLWPAMILASSRGVAVLGQFLAQLVVGLLAGASGLGVLQLFTSWTCVAGEVSALGLPTRIMRQVSVAYADKNIEFIQEKITVSCKKVLLFCLIMFLIILIIIAVIFFVTGIWEKYFWLLIAVGLVAPFFALLRLYSESLKATGATLLAITIENLISPVMILFVSGVFWVFGLALFALILVIAFSISVIVSFFAVKAAMKKQLQKTSQFYSVPIDHAHRGMAYKNTSSWDTRSDLFSLWGASVLSIAFLQFPFLIMPLYVDTADIGVFSVAYKLMNIITTLLILLAAVFGPKFARCAASSDRTGMKSLLNKSQLISMSVFLPLAVLLILFSEPLTHLFGEEFGELKLYLIIIAVGQLINAATGLSGVLLNMSGAASRELVTLVVAVVVALLGSIWVGSDYGVVGMAWVFSASIALKNIISYVMARHLLHKMGEYS